MKLSYAFLGLSVFLYSVANAELTPMSEVELESTSGQSIAEIVELIDPNQNLRFMRIRTGAEVRLNVNIDRLEFGRQFRNDPYVASFCPTFGDHSCAAGPRIEQQNPNAAINGTAAPAFTFSGVDGTPEADIIIDNLSLGRVVGGTVDPVTMINPYFEFVFDETTNALVGLRTGAERQDGSIGNASRDGACPGAANNCAGILSLSGNLNLDVGIARAQVTGIARATATPISDIFGGALDFLLGGLENSVQAIGDLPSNNTQEFFLSLNTRPITYAPAGLDGDENRLFSLNNGQILGGVPGFSLNVTDGIRASGFVALLSGVPKASNCFGGSLGPC